MIFTKRSDYGLRAAMELAAGYGSGPLSARQIAHCGKLPEPFVRKLLQELAKSGLAISLRGRHGGYVLSRSPDEVTVRETLEAFETLAPVPCLEPGHVPTTSAKHDGAEASLADVDDELLDDDGCTLEIPEFNCPARAAWHLVDEKVRQALDHVTLEDLLAEVQTHGLSREMIHAQ